MIHPASKNCHIQYSQYPCDVAVATLQSPGPLVDGGQVREDVAGEAATDCWPGPAPGVRGQE